MWFVLLAMSQKLFPSREVADKFSNSAEYKEVYFGLSVLRQRRASFFCLYYLTAHTEKTFNPDVADKSMKTVSLFFILYPQATENF